MGIVIPFAARSGERQRSGPSGGCHVLIFPGVRIERRPVDPDTAGKPKRRRRSAPKSRAGVSA